MSQERLQKILARAGVSSRRAAEQLITGGRVRVNGAVVSELGTRADLQTDKVEVDGRPIGREQHVYYLIHKPRGMVTTLRDPEDRPSLSELLRHIPERVYPVGRLDFHTSGALLLTNDGDLAQALLHPSKAVPKTYVVKISRPVDDYMLTALSTGIKLDDGYRTQPARVEHLRDEDGKSWLQITITEGKNRQIHRMIQALDTRVMRLSRVSFAGLSTEDLRPGNIRPLDFDELATLKFEYQGITRRQLERAIEEAPPPTPVRSFGRARGASEPRDRERPAREPRAREDRERPREGRAPRAREDRPARAFDRNAKRPVKREEAAPQKPRTLGDRLRKEYDQRAHERRISEPAPKRETSKREAPKREAPKRAQKPKPGDRKRPTKR